MRLSDLARGRQGRSTLLNVFALLGSGAISTLCLVLLTSQRIRVIGADDSTFVTLFVQWQMLGLTVAKVGLDSVVFAVLSGLTGRRPALRRVWLRLVLPLALGFGLLSLYSFGWAGALVCAASAAVDAWSAAQIAWRGARQQFRSVVIANLLNYPLFFAALFLLSAAGWPGQMTILACFMGSSAARALYLALLPRDGIPTDIRVDYEIGAQQGLNFLLFKSDQMFLGGVGATLLVAHQLEIRQFLFLSRFPEIVSSVAVALGAIVLPVLVVESPGSLGDIAARWHLTPARILLGVLALTVCYVPFVMFWNGPSPALALLPPFVLSALMVLPANTMTYSMLRGGFARALLRNLAMSLGLGALCLGASLAMQSVVVLAWSVPLQLSSFVLLCATLSWLEPRPLHG